MKKFVFTSVVLSVALFFIAHVSFAQSTQSETTSVFSQFLATSIANIQSQINTITKQINALVVAKSAATAPTPSQQTAPTIAPYSFSSGGSSYSGSSTPPRAPSNLSAFEVAPNRVLLTWQDNSDNEDRFIVSRGLISSTSTLPIAYPIADTIGYNDDDSVASSTTYKYTVVAENAFGTSSFAVVYASTPGYNGGRPNRPFLLSGRVSTSSTATAKSDVFLEWYDNSSNEDTFNIYFNTTGSSDYSFQYLASTARNTIGYHHSFFAGTSTKSVWYKLSASNGFGSSDRSNIIEVKLR